MLEGWRGSVAEYQADERAPWSLYYFATHCSQKNSSRAAGFSLHQQIVPRDDGLRCIWHLLAIADYVSTVCFLKEK